MLLSAESCQQVCVEFGEKFSKSEMIDGIRIDFSSSNEIISRVGSMKVLNEWAS